MPLSYDDENKVRIYLGVSKYIFTGQRKCSLTARIFLPETPPTVTECSVYHVWDRWDKSRKRLLTVGDMLGIEGLSAPHT